MGASDVPTVAARPAADRDARRRQGRAWACRGRAGPAAGLIAGLRGAVQALPANMEFVAPTVGGVDASDGSRIVADQKLDGGPSVRYDAVVVLTTKDGTAELAHQRAVRDFVADAYAHCKFVRYADDAVPLFRAVGLAEPLDDGFVRLSDATSVDDFLVHCGQLRSWERQTA